MTLELRILLCPVLESLSSFYRATLCVCAVFAIGRCLSVYLSITFVYRIQGVRSNARPVRCPLFLPPRSKVPWIKRPPPVKSPLRLNDPGHVSNAFTLFFSSKKPVVPRQKDCNMARDYILIYERAHLTGIKVSSFRPSYSVSGSKELWLRCVACRTGNDSHCSQVSDRANPSGVLIFIFSIHICHVSLNE